MGDVALVPERYIFHGGHGKAANEPGKAGQVFGQDWVALVRHGGRALLSHREELLGLGDLSALQMTDLGRKPLHGRSDHPERREEHGVPVTRDDLRGDRLRLEAKLACDVSLHARIEMREGANRAGNRAGADILLRTQKPLFSARELGIGEGKLQSECRRLGMDGVAAAHRDRVFVLDRAALQRFEQRVESARRMSAARVSWTARQVSSTSDEVMPWCMKRASGPTCSDTLVRNAMTSCFTSRSISSMRSVSNGPARARFSKFRPGFAPAAPSPLRQVFRFPARFRICSGRTRSPPFAAGSSGGSLGTLYAVAAAREGAMLKLWD